MLDRLERKLGKYAIPNLMLYVIGGYFIGYLLYFGNDNYLGFISLEPYMIIHKFQIWRIISWVLLPPISDSGPLTILWAVIMMVLYYNLGTALERTWGTFKFNLYIFGGILFTVIGAFLLYGIVPLLGMQTYLIGEYFSTYYINLSIFLAFALCYPEMKVYLYFIIPVKMKYMAIIYCVIATVNFIDGSIATKIALGASLLNFIIFFIMTKSWHYLNPKEIHRKQKFRREAQARPRYGADTSRGFYGDRGPSINAGTSHHKCAVCGRTELTNPELEFRFCSKCNGNYEYCQDHLFTHEHIH